MHSSVIGLTLAELQMRGHVHRRAASMDALLTADKWGEKSGQSGRMLPSIEPATN
jgi:hypothetical protein